MFAVSPVTVTLFVVEEATGVSLPPLTRTTSYPAMATLSVAAVQDRVAELAVTAEAVGVPGVVGACVSPGVPPPKTVASSDVWAMPFAPWKMRSPQELSRLGSKSMARSRIGSVLPLQDHAR